LERRPAMVNYVILSLTGWFLVFLGFEYGFRVLSKHFGITASKSQLMRVFLIAVLMLRFLTTGPVTFLGDLVPALLAFAIYHHQSKRYDPLAELRRMPRRASRAVTRLIGGTR
jgi:hypothetical protein